jgi:hypothetical protein
MDEGNTSTAATPDARTRCDLAWLPEAAASPHAQEGFHRAFRNFYSPTGQGDVFNAASPAGKQTVADGYMRSLPSTVSMTDDTAKQVFGHAWFACLLDAIARGDAGAEGAIRGAFGM